MGLHIAKKWLYLAGGALLIGNGLAIWQTREWGIDNFIALVLGNLCMLTAFIYLAFLYRTSQRISGWDEAKIHSTFRKTTILLGLAMLIVPFFFIVRVPFSAHDWDFFVIFRNTSFLHGRTFDHLPMTENQLLYFLRYPNNQLFGIIENTLFEGTTSNLSKIIWMTGLSSTLTSIALVAGSMSVRKLVSERMAIFYNLAAAGFLPFYVYGAQFYTDTASIPFVMLGLLFIIYAMKADKIKQQVIYWIIACLIIFAGYYIKPTVTFPLIAALCFMLLNRKWKTVLLVIPIAALSFMTAHITVDKIVSSDPTFSQKMNDRYNLPLVHWITMSFAPDNYSGGFDPNVLDYSEQFTSKAAKQEADIKLFEENVKKQGIPGILLQLGRKISYTWFNGDLRDFFYTFRHSNPILDHYFDWVGPQHPGNPTGYILLTAAQLMYWIFIVFFLWYEIYLSIFKKWKTFWFILALSIVGLTGFLLIWEANSRYLYNFAPIIITLALQGLLDFNQRKKRKGLSLVEGEENAISE